ncbi:MAG: DUF6516 family protein [Candidatus Accumulibacter sp.]|jgi:hypothetical protein|nr:DUF6516 family protein [Accumulibacter sp.]
MKAEILLRERTQLADTLFYQAVIWRVPSPVPSSAHDFKYSLALIADGVRVIGFDNERGKGDHRHRGKDEFPYEFISIEQLVDDFLEEVAKWCDAH